MKALLTMTALAAICSGCITSISATHEDATTGISSRVRVLATGSQSEALAKGFDAGPQGAILEDASGKQDSTIFVEAIRDIAVAVAPLFVRGGSGGGGGGGGGGTGDASYASPPSSDTSTVAAPTAGYSAVPGEGGVGVYGRATCGNCQAYRRAHPETELIDIDVYRADMWQALRARGFTGAGVTLPVAILADNFVEKAK